MSKRAEEVALKVYPVKGDWVGNQYGEWNADINRVPRTIFQDGYEQAEKDMLDSVCRWLEENAIYTHPRKGIKTCIINLNALREAMEEEL